MNVTITILDEVNCTITGLKEIHTKHFCDAYAIFAENHFFNPKFELGSWDGKIRYFYADGSTHAFLLPEIIPTIVKFGYKITINDLRTNTAFDPEPITKDIFSHILIEDTGEPLIFYDHQVRVANKLMSNGNGIAVVATGGGKSYICAAIATQYNKLNARVLVIVPSQDLVLQTREDFLFVGVDCGEYSGDVKDFVGHASVMSTWQALQNNPTLLKDFDVVIVDECHGLKGQVLQELLNQYGKSIVHRYGVTGTLPKGKTDAMSVRITVGEVVDTVTAKYLIDAGILAKLDIHVEQLEEDFKAKFEEFLLVCMSKKPTYKQFKDSYFPDYAAEKSYLQYNAARRQYLANRLMALRDEGNTFVMVDGVAFGKKLAASIPGAVFVSGTDKKKARKEIYNLFKDNDNLLVIANVQIASTGLNIKRIYNLVFIDIGKSFTRVIQSVGRGLRRAPDKDHVDVYDFSSDLKYGKKHQTQRTAYYNEAEYPNTKKLIDYNFLLSVDI